MQNLAAFVFVLATVVSACAGDKPTMAEPSTSEASAFHPQGTTGLEPPSDLTRRAQGPYPVAVSHQPCQASHRDLTATPQKPSVWFGISQPVDVSAGSTGGVPAAVFFRFDCD